MKTINYKKINIKNNENTKYYNEYLRKLFHLQDFLVNSEIDDNEVYDDDENVNKAFKFINDFINGK